MITSPSSLASRGFILPLVIVAMVILSILAIGAMMASYGARIQAVSTKAQTEAMLAAEAGYERAIFWMSQQTDIFGALQSGGGTGTINFGTSNCSYQVGFSGYIGAKPVFKVTSTGTSGMPTFSRIVDVNVMQETSGWAEALCRIPSGTTNTDPVYFGNGEVIAMPLHINNANDNPDQRDIWISTSGGSPRFLQKVEMGESRNTSGGSDKYSDVMSCFEDGIVFDQPGVHITDETAVQSKIARFHDSTAAAYIFTPATTIPNGTPPAGITASSSGITAKLPAVQLEFYVSGGVGMVNITNNCTVCGYKRSDDSYTYDFNVVPGTGCGTFQRYDIYAYHYKSNGEATVAVPIANTYVTQNFAGYTSDPGGQIFVNGNVVIGGDSATDPNMVVKGKITVVATGNIWIADSIKVDDNGGTQRDANGMPTMDNLNVLGLIARGAVKIIDPGISNYATTYKPGGLSNNYPGPPPTITGHTYRPVGNGTVGSSNRTLPDPTFVEAAITIGGGGWGAENVRKYTDSTHYYGDRRVYSTPQDDLYVRGSITEVIRGVVGHLGNDGYSKHYYADTRLMSGILPGDIWFSGKFIPAPAGWHDRSAN
ncbi:MAG: type II secretion system protein [Sedimentisphaerales bacterium]|jgi:type II secretory pathway pseudopilin PulG